MKTLTLQDGKLLLKLLPAHEPCRETLYLNKAGRQVRCGGQGFVKRVDGPSRCRTHFEILQRQTDEWLNKEATK